MYPWYCEREHFSDIIISASPEFLLAPVMKEFQVAAVIATDVDPHTGRFLSKNCYGAEKVRRLAARFPGCIVESFYSDSTSDQPLANLAKKAYFVAGEEIRPWREAVSHSFRAD